ncbi:MAG TPA: 2,3-diaminopropionate biosynthesis protein SbnA [Pyrinomonadaceae bacterium]
MSQGILATIGHTPLVRLNKIFPANPFRLFAKLEGFNPGGSIKDRPAISIIERGMLVGEINSGTTIIESSSGNMGIGLAQICAYYGLRFICVADAKTTKQNMRLLKTYKAEVEVIEKPDAETGEYLPARIKRVRELCKLIGNSFWPNQYANKNNAAAHYQTMQEIITESGGRVDYLFCAVSTFGTLRGCVEYLRQEKLTTTVYAVDAVGSVIFGSRKAKRLIPGHGAAVVPALFGGDLADRAIHVSDLDCVVGCRRLVNTEAILAGGSSGAVLMAVKQVSDQIPDGATCVMIFPDRGERYLDTIYEDDWVYQNFGDVSHLWEIPSTAYEAVTVNV